MRATSQGKGLRNMVQLGLGSNVISSLSCNQKRPETTWFHQHQTTINSTSTDIPIGKTGWNSSSSFIKFCHKRGVVSNYSALVSMRWEKPLIHPKNKFDSACLLVALWVLSQVHSLYLLLCLTNSKSLPINFGSILASRAETSCGTYSSWKVSSRTGDCCCCCCCCEEDLHKQGQLELNKMCMKFGSMLSHSRKSWVLQSFLLVFDFEGKRWCLFWFPFCSLMQPPIQFP